MLLNFAFKIATCLTNRRFQKLLAHHSVNKRVGMGLSYRTVREKFNKKRIFHRCAVMRNFSSSVEHGKRNVVSPSHHTVFFLLCKILSIHTKIDVIDDFLKISDLFRRFPNVLQNLSRITRIFLNIFKKLRRLPRISKDNRGLPETSEEDRKD